ncbi:helix-turn-helix domain-containing protein [Hydrogenophaga sp. UC242_50]|uniref:helix-turn-helix domain-containing protein n=1 Tax=unclassified Hydrogenophaga TaxID=2610897 RepID=UPI0036D319B5
MTTFATSLKKEIARIARKELRDEFAMLRKSSASYRSDIAELKRKIKSLESQVKSLGRSTSRAEVAPKEIAPPPRSTPGRKVKFGPTDLLTLRQKLGFTQAQMGTLVGVSSLSIYKWESGQVTPRATQLEKLLAVRKIGKRAAMARLQA